MSVFDNVKEMLLLYGSDVSVKDKYGYKSHELSLEAMFEYK